MPRYWVSWWEDAATASPLEAKPLTPALIGWWWSGMRQQGAQQAVCAVINGVDTAAQAQKVIVRAGRKPIAWRWVESKPPEWMPSDRFRAGEVTAEDAPTEVTVRVGGCSVPEVTVYVSGLASSGPVERGLRVHVPGGASFVVSWKDVEAAYQAARRWRDANAGTSEDALEVVEIGGGA